MTTQRTLVAAPAATTALIVTGFALSACSGGGSHTSSTPGTDPTGSSSSGSTSKTASTTGLWKGTITSGTTGQSSTMVALIDVDGHSAWMTTDGRVYDGTMPMTGDQFVAQMIDHMEDGSHFHDGTNLGPGSMMVDSHSSAMMNGRYSGNGDSGTFGMTMSPMWNYPASLPIVAGVYTRSSSTGYTMTMTIGANGQLVANDSRGCTVNGTVHVPDGSHNLYRIDATITTCGSLDGAYHGMGALLDADAMKDWMSSMMSFDHGGHMMSGSGMMGQSTVPTGQHNLFMFSLTNDQNAIMDALAK